MSLISKIFGEKKSSAKKATNRLKLVLAHERADNSLPYLEDMKRDIIKVIEKYTSAKKIDIKTENSHNIDMLEVEIILGKNG